ncbi:MAG: hypothetical protein KDI10_17785 [Halioglobus sp.]|nr:hypothetical protein [Halioglobus sp.]MCB1710563.1 hypothetical protein [Halioglobus sp.]MCP5123910.1 hypothetical protein [Pseudomonadales bacterium]MCP5192725.1 hypothetical protein [Pseudomonadales bacterium]
MKYLLILFVLAIALAPLSHFIPSKRQREIARMREYAAVHGMFVEFRAVPGRDSGRSRDRDSAGHDTIYYGKRLPPAKTRARRVAQAWLYDNGAWVAHDSRVEAPAAVKQMPPQVLAAGIDEASCGVYWRESGGVGAVEQIRQLLEVWAGELRA